MKEAHRVTGSLAALYTGQFLFLGLQLPYFSGWLDQNGFSAPEIGLINGGALITRLLGGPFVAIFVDRLRDQRVALIGVSVLFCLCAVLINFVSWKIILAVLASLLIWSFGLLVPLTDSTVLRADRCGFLQYGQVRAAGTFAFLLATLAGGWVVDQYGMGSVAPLLGIATVLALTACFFIPESISGKGRVSATQTIRWADAGRLISHPVFLCALMAAAMTQGGHAVYYTYSILDWTAKGFSTTFIGLLWATGVIAEIVFLSKGRSFTRRLGTTGLLMLGGAAAAFRWFLISLEPTIYILIPIQTLHALTFGAAYLGAVEFVNRAIPQSLMNTGMVLFSTTGVGAMTGLAALISGFVVAEWGTSVAYMIMSAMGVIAVMFALLLREIWKGNVLITD